MGWDLDIRTRQSISPDHINHIVENLPDELKSPWGSSKQDWGWSTCVDIINPRGKILPLHGASFSSKYIEPIVSHLKTELKKLGYTHLHSTKPSW